MGLKYWINFSLLNVKFFLLKWNIFSLSLVDSTLYIYMHNGNWLLKREKKTTNIHTSWAFTLFSVALRWRIFVSFCSFLCCCCCCCIFSPDFCYCSFFFNHLFNPFPLRVWFRQRAYTYTTFKLTLWMCVRIGMCVLHMRCKHKYPK